MQWLEGTLTELADFYTQSVEPAYKHKVIGQSDHDKFHQRCIKESEIIKPYLEAIELEIHKRMNKRFPDVITSYQMTKIGLDFKKLYNEGMAEREKKKAEAVEKATDGKKPTVINMKQTKSREKKI